MYYYKYMIYGKYTYTGCSRQCQRCRFLYLFSADAINIGEQLKNFQRTNFNVVTVKILASMEYWRSSEYSKTVSCNIRTCARNQNATVWLLLNSPNGVEDIRYDMKQRNCECESVASRNGYRSNSVLVRTPDFMQMLMKNALDPIQTCMCCCQREWGHAD